MNNLIIGDDNTVLIRAKETGSFVEARALIIARDDANTPIHVVLDRLVLTPGVKIDNYLSSGSYVTELTLEKAGQNV